VTADDAPRAVRLDLDGLAERACQVANRSLSPGEWERLVDPESEAYREVCPGRLVPSDDPTASLERYP
jgi:hypothetical protein